MEDGGAFGLIAVWTAWYECGEPERGSMAKICPKCRRHPSEELLVMCKDCKELYVEEKDAPLYLSRDGVESVVKVLVRDWRFWVPLALGILTVAGIVDVLTGWNLRTLQRELVLSGSNQIAEAERSITSQIVAELKEPRIRETIQDVARGEAKSILRGEILPVVQEFRTNVEAKLESISEQQDFMWMITGMRANDFGAYRKLLDAAAGTNRVAKYANGVAEQIQRELQLDRFSQVYQGAAEIEGKARYTGPFATDEIARTLGGASKVGPRVREAWVNAARTKGIKLVVGALVDLLQKESDLLAANRITYAISELTGEEFYPRDLTRLNRWWEENKGSYTNWPYSECEQGDGAFSGGRYAEALGHFQEVLRVDPTADRTRALAVACAWEVGNTNTARALLAGFAIREGRWEQWAEAKSELATGSVERATLKFVEIATNYPTFHNSSYLDGRWDVLRQVDWKLFEERRSSAAQKSR